ncbi:phenylalanine--tRNA ligase subunit alpha [candidate division WOR-3 bacterium]|uniref:Phenylalanine--tRNA ligase alpha subunit n=1 Tax=candidate division WOR-3 bacterium TaxID=2052148 RepID=A0A937XD27_UNCW3|nr:phenylalanine--tRNA ligase subunit alpha [candidate division WOR-3 bacterium]
MTRLPEIEYRILAALDAGKALAVADIVKQTGADQSLVMAGATLLAQRELVTIAEDSQEEFSLTDEGKAAAVGFPERKALNVLKATGGAANLSELPRLLGKDDVRAEIKWLTRKGWCTRDAGVLAVSAAGEAALAAKGADESFVKRLVELGQATESELADAGFDVKAALELLKGRNELLKRKKRVSRKLSLTEPGAALKAGGIEPAVEVSQLTPELLASGTWRDVVFRKYDPALATAPKYPGKEHPLQRVIQEIRQAFFEMGFEEVASPTVDTAFWVFDALFQPQDHPAREMQDTFYVAEPKRGRLPGEHGAENGDSPMEARVEHSPVQSPFSELVERVKRTHEDGGDTGSTGWRSKWDIEKARQLVLRTHTTSASIRALAANPKPPRKVFCIGKTFRREATDQTHLAEFMQIDGIIIDEQATLATLFGTLEAFYKKMGAEEVRFRPSFFPYTEPSAEVFAKMGKLGWVEMCGSGVFRPEVTQPLGCKVPVLAWGGGVERIAMLRFGLDDIRKLYMADIDWLRQARLGG